MPRAFTEYEKGLIRQQLLKNGYRLFSAYGLRKTNVEELAGAAGISKGAFYLFYESKEALFMDVIEQVEQRFREELLRLVDLPGPSPRARLFTVLRHAFRLVKTMPILQFLTGGDFDLLYRRVPRETFQEHIASDRVFVTELISHCRSSGIPIQARPEEIIGLLYPLVVAILHAGDYGAFRLGGGVDMFLELVAAFCLGEVEINLQQQHGEDLPSSMLSFEEGYLP